tara:strand:- start:1381 stop:1752 length:372 start_codon:yes stop_codon:yes gene_type:complete
MNKKVSWDQSLVKKFSSSNHFKLLNQLKSEVIKYPLTRKKNQYTRSNSVNKIESKNNSNNNSEKLIPQSTISFNNSKNFSIYNNNDKDIIQEDKENKDLEIEKSIKDNSLSTFKDRLNNIDMK